MCRIISYNIHSGIGRDKKQDYRRIGRLLASNDADIVLLQEMDTRPSERNIERDISDICAGGIYQLVPSPAIVDVSGWYGNAILSRFPVLNNETFDVSQLGREPRNIQTATVQTTHGPLSVVNTHKGLKKRERRSQFALLHDYIGRRLEKVAVPLVLAGDFNEWQFFTRAFQSLDSILNQHLLGPTFPSHFPLFSLDRIWTTPDISVTSCRKLQDVGSRLFSDHLPIMIDITFPDSAIGVTEL